MRLLVGKTGRGSVHVSSVELFHSIYVNNDMFLLIKFYFSLRELMIRENSDIYFFSLFSG